MEAAIADVTPRRALAERASEKLPAAATWLLGFVPVVYLGLSGGGYDIIARSEIGLVIWWVVLLGALIGVLPRRRLGTAAWIGIALLGGFLAWTWIAVGWSQSAERSLAEATRVATYLGVFVLGATLVTRATVRHLLCGLACAIALVSALAVLSRLVPSWFPANGAARLYMTARLEYPFDYADAVGEFAALGLPLLLFVASDARSALGRALGAAAIPVVVLCVALTVSRGGVLATVVGLLLYLALVPDRLPRLATALAGAGASAVVIAALLHRAAVRDGFISAAAAGQRHAVLVTLALACAGVGLAQVGISTLAASRARPPRQRSRRLTAVAMSILPLCVAGAIVALVASGADHQLWEQFKRPTAPAAGNTYFRLFSISGSHRYQYWQVAGNAFDAHPWKGIGPGTFEFYWAQHQTLGEFVRNAHSLYVETLAELGIVGLALIGGFVVFVLVAGSTRTLRAPLTWRAPIATSVATFGAFAAAASFDWVWQIGVIPIVALLAAAGATARLRDETAGFSDGRPPGGRFAATRLLLAGGFVAALVAIAVPLASTSAVRSSQAAARAGNYAAALKDAASAQRIEPSAATPRLQRALVLEAMGDLPAAAGAIGEAEAREPTNWRIWLVASRLAARTGHPQQALADYRRARSLNPTSPLFRS